MSLIADLINDARHKLLYDIQNILYTHPTKKGITTMNNAAQIMYRFRDTGTVVIAGDRDGAVCMIEDVTDPDGRVYRMEYKSTPDGRHALAWCRSNPWDRRNSNAGVGYSDGHVNSEGLLCLGASHGSNYSSSPYDIASVIRRSRYWCTAFSVLKETGRFPQL